MVAFRMFSWSLIVLYFSKVFLRQSFLLFSYFGIIWVLIYFWKINLYYFFKYFHFKYLNIENFHLKYFNIILSLIIFIQLLIFLCLFYLKLYLSPCWTYWFFCESSLNYSHLFFQLVSVCWGCHRKFHRMRTSINRNLFLIVQRLEVKFKVPLRFVCLPLACRWLLRLTILTWSFLCFYNLVSLWVWISSSQSDVSHIGLGLT